MVAGELYSRRPLDVGTVLFNTGAVMSIFSVIGGFLVVFVIPAARGYLGGIEVIILGMVLVLGIAALLIGGYMRRRGRLTRA